MTNLFWGNFFEISSKCSSNCNDLHLLWRKILGEIIVKTNHVTLTLLN